VQGYGSRAPISLDPAGDGGGLHRGDLLLASNELPPWGAHVVSRRRGYLHHGIYVGNGNVVHYGGLARGLRRGPIEETSFARFAHGQLVWIRCGNSARFDSQEVVRRALSRVGEDRYRVLTNNCEHFCEWCLRGAPHSYQIERWFSWLWRGLRTMTGLSAGSFVGNAEMSAETFANE
jgi:Lecithin retinol acyltransferase